MRWSGKCERIRSPHTTYRLRLRHSHGGTGRGSAQSPFFASRASFSSHARKVCSGAYFRYHQHQPSMTSSSESCPRAGWRGRCAQLRCSRGWPREERNSNLKTPHPSTSATGWRYNHTTKTSVSLTFNLAISLVARSPIIWY